MRECVKCGIGREPSGFYRGHAQCKECVRTRVSLHRMANIDRVRAYDRERAKRPEKMASIAAISRRWARLNPEWKRAQTAVANAIRGGLLMRPSRCSRCKVSCKAEAHHWDYSRPLVVEWLCKPCHARADAERRDVA